MPKLDATHATCHVLTFKEGLLSAVAHDLRLRVGRLSIDLDPSARSVRATFDPTSIAVECAMKGGREAPGTLRDKDRRDVVKNIEKDVLHPRKHREIRFEGSWSGDAPTEVEGTLALHGKSRRVRVGLRRDGDAVVGEVTLHQPDFGIRPFSALFGTLKIKPDVRVVLRLPASAALPPSPNRPS